MVWFEIVRTTCPGQFLSVVVEETSVFAPGVLTSDGLPRIGSACKGKVEDWAGSHRLTVLLVPNGRKLGYWGASAMPICL